jgi:hypothetical protein
VRVQVSYLRTYDERATSFDVFYCGKNLSRFESRWGDRVR